MRTHDDDDEGDEDDDNVADDDAGDDTDEPSRSRTATKMTLSVLVKICGFEIARVAREWHLTPFPGLLMEEILHHFNVWQFSPSDERLPFETLDLILLIEKLFPGPPL